LALEALVERVVLAVGVVEHLDGHAPAELEVGARIDASDPALTERSLYAIAVGEDLANRVVEHGVAFGIQGPLIVRPGGVPPQRQFVPGSSWYEISRPRGARAPRGCRPG